MADPIRQLLSQTSYVADGSQTVWNFSFSGGYIDKSHVKAKYLDAARVEHQITVTPGMFLGQYQLNITPPISAGRELVIYRDTPKDGPLVDFIDAASLIEASLDLSAKQGVFVAAESSDLLLTTIASTDQIQSTLVQAEASRDQAAASQEAAGRSASDALASLHEYKGSNYGPLPDNPTVDPLGNPVGLGDEYFNTSTNTKRIYRAAGWLDFEAAAKSSANASEASRQVATAQAVISTSQAALASQQVPLAAAQVALAATAKTAAETARDAAQLSAGVYASTAAGIAATNSIANKYFSVPSAESAESLILYLNSAGAAVEQKRYPSATRIATLEAETINYRASGDPIRPSVVTGWGWNVADEIGKIAIGVKSDGAFVASTVEAKSLTVQSVATQAFTAQSIALPATSLTDDATIGYAWAVKDGAGNVAMGVRTDGTVDIGRANITLDSKPDLFGGVFSHQYNIINNTGQSLAVGASGGVTTTQEYGNLVMPTTAPYFSVAAGGGSENPLLGTLGHVKKLLLEENGLSWQASDYTLVGTTNASAAQGIDALSKGGSTGVYENFMTQLASAMTVAASQGKTLACRAVTWTQGEANNGMSVAAYMAKEIALAENYNTDSKAITGQGQNIAFISYQCCSVYYKDVPVAQWQAAIEHPLIHLAAPIYFMDYVDFQHINNVSEKWLGGYYGLVYKRVVVDGKQWEPLQPQSVQIVGNNIDIYFNKPGLTLDTVLMPAQISSGFGVLNGATPVTISSVTLLPGNRVRLAMASTPQPGWSVQYGHNSVTGKSPFVGGGGNLRDNAGDLLKYINKPMHNWCVIFNWSL